MSYARLAERLFNAPLLLAPDKAETIAAVFNAYVAGNVAELPKYEPPARVDLASSMSMRRADGGYYLTNSGVAVLQVHGSLVQRSGGLDSMSGLMGYNGITNMLSSAVRDPGVRGVVIEFDSPGGEVAGVMEMAGMIAEADKPVWAHANELAASAAYWLAAAADRVYAPTTGMLGSIGVLMLHADRSRQIDKAGIVYTPIFAGARKLDGSSMAPLTEEARSWAQDRVDQVYNLFVAHVAAQRGMSEKKVRDTEAAVYSVQDAKKMGLADDVATLGETIQMMTDDLNTGRSKRKSYGRAAANAQDLTNGHLPGRIDMDEKDKGAAPATQAQLDAARAEGKAEAQADADKAAKIAAEAQASGDAKARVKAILGCEAAKERPALAQHLALDTAMSAEDAIGVLAKAAKETVTNSLAAKMPQNPKVGADGDGSSGAAAAVDTAGIYAARRSNTLHAVK